MPLEDYAPVIDNRRYDDILAEVRTRIARYTPEWAPWTDLNDNDPGITLAQLFAWMTEMMIFRLGKVPEQNYLKFLQLLGIELQPAAPAQAEITFPVLNTYPASNVIIPAGTQVAAESDEGAAMIVFETERPLIALAAQLAAVQTYDGYAHHDYSSENKEAEQEFHPFGPHAQEGSALLLGFRSNHPFPASVELNLALWVVEQAFQTAPYDCNLRATAIYAPAEIVWEYWNGRDWLALTLLKDETSALTRSGHIYFKTPTKGAMPKATLGSVAEALYWIRGRLINSQYERPPKLTAVRTNTVTAIQGETVRHEVLGASDGCPNQLFRLSRAPVLDGSLRLEVDEGSDFQPWTPVEDFLASSSSDNHYVLNRTSGEILFGNGRNGAIPVANVANTINVVAREYRFGGGRQGNVAAGKLTTLLSSVRGIDENGITNLRPACGGRDEETFDQAKARARRSVKSKGRAVTAEDFEHLAQQAANIKRAKALPLYHPNFPNVQVPGVMTVIVVPDSDLPNPLPSEGSLRLVCDYLNQRRLLTTELYVIPPSYKEVCIDVEAIAEANADLAEVKEGIEQTLLDYFHPLKGGEDGQGWPFGGDIYFSLAYRRALTVVGVQRIESLTIWLDGQEMAECQDITISTGVLVYSKEHNVSVSYAFDY